MDYTIKFSKKKKRITISIKNGKDVVVSAPVGYSVKKIEEFINKNAKWIESHLKKLNPDEAFNTDFKDGGKFLFMGKVKILRFYDGKEVKLDGENFLCPKDCKEIKEALCSFYKCEAEKTLKIRLYNLAFRYGFRVNKSALSSAKTTWGSCNSKGSIRLNYRLIFFESRVSDYVIIHELCHLKEMNHGEKFWALVEKYKPDYRECKKEIKKLSYLINF